MSFSWKLVLVVIPTYNERENIGRLVQSLLGISPDISLLIVDDQSPDGTGMVVEELSRENENIHLLQRKKCDGFAGAYLSGFKWALKRKYYDYIIQMDADLSHDPHSIKDFLMEMEGSEVVIGSRYLDNFVFFHWNFYRSILSFLAASYIRLFTGISLNDPMSGFKCFSRRSLDCVDLNSFSSKGYVFQLEMNIKIIEHGFKVVEVPINFRDRERGKSKMDFKIILEAFLFVLKLNFRFLK